MNGLRTIERLCPSVSRYNAACYLLLPLCNDLPGWKWNKDAQGRDIVYIGHWTLDRFLKGEL